jgi:tight adherence protein B
VVVSSFCALSVLLASLLTASVWRTVRRAVLLHGLPTPARPHRSMRGTVVAAVFVLVVFLGTTWMFALACALGVATALFAIAKHAEQHRRRADLDDLVDAFEQVRQGLQAGCGLFEALDELHGHSPARRDLGAVGRRFRSGATLAVAMERWRAGSDERAVRITANGLLLTLRAGGSSSSAIDSGLEVARQLRRASRLVDAQSAQARASMAVLTALPVIALAIELLVSAEIRHFVMGSVPGGALVLAGVVLNAAGLIVAMRAAEKVLS